MTAAAAPTTPPVFVPDAFFGVSTTGEVTYDPLARDLAIKAGAQMVRTSVHWSSVEKTKGNYDWSSSDSALNLLLDNNLVPLVLIFDNPAWAANTPCGPVNDLEAFVQFVHSLAARYPRVTYWSLYNEVDNANYPPYSSGGCFGGDDLNGNGTPDYADYAEMLHFAWSAIHEVNPNAHLVSGAVAFDNFNEAAHPDGYPGGGRGGHFNYNFVPQLFNYIKEHPLASNAKYFDIFSFNFYGIYGAYWERQIGGIGISAKVNMLNRLLSEANISAPMLVSETGENSYENGNFFQSEYLTKNFARGLASGLAAMVWWTFKDNADNLPPPSNTHKYGIVDQDTKPKPSFAAFQTASRELTGFVRNQMLKVAGGEGYLFAKGGEGKAIIWSSSDSPITVTFAATRVQVTDLYGAQKVIEDGDADDHDSNAGRIGLSVDKSPVYVQLLAN